MTTTSLIKSEESANTTEQEWCQVCKTDDLVIDSGVCVLVGNKQIALFTVNSGENKPQVFACDNYDPLGRANVLSRGLLSSIGPMVCVCSPLYKQHYSLLDGKCVEDEQVSVGVYKTRLQGDEVFVLVPNTATN
jgi:nitrite reductase (NADH) small subunit